jgi:hypothetical protein
MRTGAQFGTRAAAANDLASTRQQINQGLLDNADQMDTAAYQTAAGQAGLGYDLGPSLIYGEQTRIDRAQASAAANQALWNSVMGSIGMAGGSFAGSMNNNKPNTYSYNPQPATNYGYSNYNGINT